MNSYRSKLDRREYYRRRRQYITSRVCVDLDFNEPLSPEVEAWVAKQADLMACRFVEDRLQDPQRSIPVLVVGGSKSAELQMLSTLNASSLPIISPSRQDDVVKSLHTDGKLDLDVVFNVCSKIWDEFKIPNESKET